jgi:hypothetical protein
VVTVTSGLILPLLYLARKAEASQCSKEVQFRTYDLRLVPFKLLHQRVDSRA